MCSKFIWADIWLTNQIAPSPHPKKCETETYEHADVKITDKGNH